MEYFKKLILFLIQCIGYFPFVIFCKEYLGINRINMFLIFITFKFGSFVYKTIENDFF
jgi:hypothetical protein